LHRETPDFAFEIFERTLDGPVRPGDQASDLWHALKQPSGEFRLWVLTALSMALASYDLLGATSIRMQLLADSGLSAFDSLLLACGFPGDVASVCRVS
jgi:hypothetical protein